MNKVFDLIAIGRAAIDLNAIDYNKPMEETRNFAKYVGGSPVNIAINSVNLGLNAGFIGKISADQHGNYIRNTLEKVGVDTTNLFVDTKGHKSGLTFTEILSPKECSILMYREEVADLYLEPIEVSEAYIKQTKYLLVSGTALSKSPSREAVLQAVLYAERNHVDIIFELDHRPYSWESDEVVNIYYSLVAQKSKLIIGTRQEFDMIDRADDTKLVKKLFVYAPEVIVIKNGVQGAKGYIKNGTEVSAKAYQSKVLKTFGAGDSFAAAFIYAYIHNFPLEKALSYGNAAASIVISEHSSSESMPTIDKIEEVVSRDNVIV